MTEILKKLIDILRDGKFHSGEQLGKSLGITRSAIWKFVKQLKAWDIEIKSVTKKGYCIPNGLNLLNREKILSAISDKQKSLINEIQLFDTLPSTNDYLLNSCSTKLKKCQVCFAERQTAGKGRLGRTWVSPFAKNIYLSLLWHFPRDPSELSGLSLAVAIAVTETLKTFGITENLSLKWPNDVLWKYKKLAGTLIEFSCEANNICNTVIGIGLNIDMPYAYEEKISQPWIDLKTITREAVDRNAIAGALLNELLKTLILFQNEGLTPFIPLWQALDTTFGQPVSVTTPTTILQGINRGINAQGHFLLENAQNEIKNYSSGEISILK